MMLEEKEIIIAAPETAEMRPAERDPSALGPQEVAGRTLVSLVSAGTELAALYQGTTFPGRPGYAAVFRIEEVGAEVTGFQPGDAAFCMGPHRSFQRFPEADVLRVPDTLAPESAVFARMMGITLSTLTTTTARPPQQVLVTGLGPVGHLAAQIFSMAGYQVAGCDPSEARREIARQHGITTLFPAVPLDDPSLCGQVALVLECSGHEAAALAACRIVRRRGEVVLVGVPWQPRTQLSAHALLHAVFHQYAVLRSGWEWELPVHAAPHGASSMFENFEAALRWLASGRISVNGLGTEASPADAQSVYQNLLHGRAERLAMLFRWAS